MKTLLAADLFCGVGGLAQAAEGTDFSVSVSLDNWDCALKTHRANFDTETIKADLKDVDTACSLIQSHPVEIIMGGPPCQDFSSAGGGVEGDRAALTFSFASIVTRLAPRIFLMENVPSAQKSNAYTKARSLWNEMGYHLCETIVDSAYFGVPQHRRRLIVVGSRDKNIANLTSHIHARESLLATTIRDFWPDVPFDHYYRHPRSYQRRAVFSVDEPSPTIRGVNRPRPANYIPHSSDTTKEAVSGLTTEQRARLQTFPDDFSWQGTKSEIDQMIGNCVPPLLGKHIIEAVTKWMHNPTQTPQSLHSWLCIAHNYTPRAAGDVVSRLRRIQKFSPRQPNEDEETFLLRIHQSRKTLANLPRTAQPQVERALDLYEEYKSSMKQPTKDQH